MNIEVNSLIASAKTLADEARTTYGGLSKEELNIKPSSVEWSIAQCFDHLNTISELYLPGIQIVADGTHVNNWFSKIPFITDKVGGLLIKAVSPESEKKHKAPPIFAPSESDISETIIDDFCKIQEKIIAFMVATKDQDTSQIKIPTPLTPIVNIRLIDAFEMPVLHERRHFGQAKRVLDLVSNLR